LTSFFRTPLALCQFYFKIEESRIEMLTRTTTSQNFNVDQRINSWMVVQQKDKKDSGVLDCNQGLALGNFICKIYKPLGQNFIIKKYLEQCTLYKNKPNILIGMRESILQYLETPKN